MKLFNKILCAIDFSQTSVKALQWTEYLAEKYQSEVIILHVMETYPIGTASDIGIDWEYFQKAVTANFNEFVAPLRIKYEKMISTGNPAHKIVALADGLQASVIIMGTRGIQGTAHKLLGSTAETVMRNASVPVFTISPHCNLPKTDDKHNILIPLASIYRPPRGFLKFRKIIRELSCIPTFLHIVNFHDEMFGASFDANPFLTATHEGAEKAEQLAKIGVMIYKNGHHAPSLIQFGDVVTEILKELDALKYDYILLGARKKNLLSRFVETNAYKVISQSPVPVITIKTE